MPASTNLIFAPPPPPPLQTSSTNGRPSLLFALIPLAFVCATLILTVIYYAYRLARTISSRPQYNIPSSASLPPPQLLPFAPSPPRRAISAPPDLENGEGLQEGLVERSDSVTNRAVAWARSMLSGPPPQTPSGNSSGIGRGRGKSNKALPPVTIPVKEAILVLSPDGETSLGVTTEVLVKDACLQVTEADLLAWSARSSSSSSHARWRATPVETREASTQMGPSRSGSREALTSNTERVHHDSDVSAQGGGSSSSSQLPLPNPVFKTPPRRHRSGDIGGGSSSRARRHHEATSPRALTTTATTTPTTQNTAETSSITIMTTDTNTATLGEVNDDADSSHAHDRRSNRHKRRRRKRHTRDFSCQTDD